MLRWVLLILIIINIIDKNMPISLREKKNSYLAKSLISVRQKSAGRRSRSHFLFSISGKDTVRFSDIKIRYAQQKPI